MRDSVHVFLQELNQNWLPDRANLRVCPFKVGRSSSHTLLGPLPRGIGPLDSSGSRENREPEPLPPLDLGGRRSSQLSLPLPPACLSAIPLSEPAIPFLSPLPLGSEPPLVLVFPGPPLLGLESHS